MNALEQMKAADEAIGKALGFMASSEVALQKLMAIEDDERLVVHEDVQADLFEAFAQLREAQRALAILVLTT
jgi:hypothetical protein